MSENIDIFNDIKIGDINLVTEKARKMYQLENEISKKEAELKEKKSLYNFISTEELPSIMEQERIENLTMDNGYRLTLKPFISASIPSLSQISKIKDAQEAAEQMERRQEAFVWLKENDASAIISNEITIKIPKSEDGEKMAKEILTISEQFGLSANYEESVHSSTLKSYIKEQLEKEDGREIPFDTFKIYSGRIAKIEKPKNIKGKK